MDGTNIQHLRKTSQAPNEWLYDTEEWGIIQEKTDTQTIRIIAFFEKIYRFSGPDSKPSARTGKF
jgi:hypothetical protein